MLRLTNRSWDLCSYGLLFLYAFFQILQWPLLPRFVDIYYHLGVVKGFADAGGYVSTALWENAPAGRPHLYPPLLHAILLLFYKAGLPFITLARGVDCVSYPLFLFSFHYVISRLYTKRFAFISLFILSSVYSLMLASVTLSTFNLAFILVLFAFLQMEKMNAVAAGLCLALCFYTHTLIGWLGLCPLFIYGALKPERRSCALKAAILSLVLASPFLMLQFHHRASFALVEVYETKLWEVDLTLWALALCGLVSLLLRKELKDKPVFLALFFGFFPLLFSHPPRYLSGHGMIGAILLAAHFVDDLLSKALEKNKVTPAFTVLLILAGFFITFLAPVWEWNRPAQTQKTVWGERTLTRSLFFGADRIFRANSFSIYSSNGYGQIADVIKKSSEPDDILWADFSYAAGILSMMSDRATSSAMLAEVRPFEKRDEMRDARILVWFKDEKGNPIPEMKHFIERYHLSLLKETDLAFVLLNPSGYAKSVRQSPLIPTVLLECLLFFTGFLLWRVTRRKR